MAMIMWTYLEKRGRGSLEDRINTYSQPGEDKGSDRTKRNLDDGSSCKKTYVKRTKCATERGENFSKKREEPFGRRGNIVSTLSEKGRGHA